MSLYDSTADGKPDAHAVGFSGHKRLENAFHVGGAYARTAVTYLHLLHAEHHSRE